MVNVGSRVNRAQRPASHRRARRPAGQRDTGAASQYMNSRPARSTSRLITLGPLPRRLVDQDSPTRRRPRRPLVVTLPPGQTGDSPMLMPSSTQRAVKRLAPGRPRTRPDAVLGDKAYSSRAIRADMCARGIKAVIP